MAIFERKKKSVSKKVEPLSARAKKEVGEAREKARKAELDAKIAKARAEAAQKKMKKMEVDKKIANIRAKYSKARPVAGPGIPGMYTSAAAPKIIARHTVKKGDTLSAIAKKYYGSGAKKYYELIQSANKDLIKDVNLIYPDQVFKIPELPPELKK
jgi:nucleoid-associated protein YgaU